MLDIQTTTLLDFISLPPENPVLWTGMKGVSAGRRKNNRMLKQVQHDMETWFFSVLSSRTCFGIWILVLELVFKAPPYGRVSLRTSALNEAV
jgi:hypothetical protein